MSVYVITAVLYQVFPLVEQSLVCWYKKGCITLVQAMLCSHTDTSATLFMSFIHNHWLSDSNEGVCTVYSCFLSTKKLHYMNNWKHVFLFKHAWGWKLRQNSPVLWKWGISTDVAKCLVQSLNSDNFSPFQVCNASHGMVLVMIASFWLTAVKIRHNRIWYQWNDQEMFLMGSMYI